MYLVPPFILPTLSDIEKNVLDGLGYIGLRHQAEAVQYNLTNRSPNPTRISFSMPSKNNTHSG